MKGKGMPHDWSQEMIRRFRELHRQPAASFSGIAAQLSSEFKITLTRNACIGKAHRLNLPLRLRPHAARKVTITAKVIKMKNPATHPFAPITLAKIMRDPQPFTLLITDLETGDCKWPSGEANAYPPFFYCGMPALAGCPYCKTHTERASSSWRAPQP